MINSHIVRCCELPPHLLLLLAPSPTPVKRSSAVTCPNLDCVNMTQGLIARLSRPCRTDQERTRTKTRSFRMSAHPMSGVQKNHKLLLLLQSETLPECLHGCLFAYETMCHPINLNIVTPKFSGWLSGCSIPAEASALTSRLLFLPGFDFMVFLFLSFCCWVLSYFINPIKASGTSAGSN